MMYFKSILYHLVSRNPPEVGTARHWVGELLYFLKVVGHRHRLPDLLRGHLEAAKGQAFITTNYSLTVSSQFDILHSPIFLTFHNYSA